MSRLLDALDSLVCLAKEHVVAAILAGFMLVFALACLIAQLTIKDPIEAGPIVCDAAVQPKDISITLADVRDAYGAAEHDALGLLAANAWADQGGDTVVTFTTREVRVTGSGHDSRLALVVLDCNRERVERDGVWQNRYTLALATPAWQAIATLVSSDPKTPTDPPEPPTLRCSRLAGGATLTCASELKELTVYGLGKGAATLAHTTPQEVASSLASWAGVMRPTASCATFKGVVETDVERDEHRLRFTLDDRRASEVVVAVLASGRIEVREHA